VVHDVRQPNGPACSHEVAPLNFHRCDSEKMFRKNVQKKCFQKMFSKNALRMSITASLHIEQTEEQAVGTRMLEESSLQGMQYYLLHLHMQQIRSSFEKMFRKNAFRNVQD